MRQDYYSRGTKISSEKEIQFQIRKKRSFRCSALAAMIITILLGYSFTSCNNIKKDKQESFAQQNSMDIKTLDYMLKEWGNSYTQKVDKEYHTIVNFKIPNTDTSYHIIIRDNQFQLFEGLHDEAYFTFKSSMAHYNKIYRGEMTAFTSIGREKMSDSTPLDMEFEPPVTAEQMNDFLFFVQRFFNTTPYDKVELGKDHSRIVHGGHAIPIFYRKNNEIGVRSAWYQVNKGQQVNEPGDTNPFPQYFIIKQGEGFAKIGNDTLQIKENESYYIAPGSDHVFWTESEKPMEMIFLAWGKGA